ncbi:hypothetical protein [Thalassovita taeanensis]|uniref:Type IV pilus biogenesis n=1 Tax=Thalassovita taeanensis TaxID=657014 RepID=A0A1H9FSM2_9RHOB|nr:hypothetical protein [Thalassovita taeanensis]SEQ40894.1 hypothetical protein SAMN04488092_106199 [Thalassovita taeanensis]
MTQSTPAPSNATTAQAATQENTLPLTGVTLIGTVIAPSGPTAFVRLARGAVKRVTPGDRINGAIVAAIGEGTLHLQRGSSVTALTMPGS